MNLKKKFEELRKQQMSKKGQVGAWLTAGIAVIGGLVVWAVSAIVMQAFRDSQTTNSYAYNISQGGLTFLANASSQLGTAGTILGVSLLLVIMGAVGFGAYMGYQKFR